MQFEPETRDRPRLPTGFAALDTALFGGLPRGSLVELFGPPCGKSTLALQVTAHLQRAGLETLWMDADGTFDPAWASALGVDLNHLTLARVETAEGMLAIATRLAASGAVGLLVVDSAAALTPELELKADLAGDVPGLHARVLASGLRGLHNAVGRSGSLVLFLNQLRTRVERGAGEPETAAGGPALKLYCAVRIALAPAGGLRVRFRVLKNRSGGGFADGELEWVPGRGFAKSP
jgi:recombination protein RecA